MKAASYNLHPVWAEALTKMSIFEFHGVPEPDIYECQTGSITLTDLQATLLAAVPTLEMEPLPWSAFREHWEWFRSDYREGDEIWTFDTFPKSDGVYPGRKGYALVREGKIINILVTLME